MRVNGYDEKDAKKMLNDWNNLSTENSKSKKKKVSMFTPESDNTVEKK